MCIVNLIHELKDNLDDEFIAYKVVCKKTKYAHTYYPIFFDIPIKMNDEIVSTNNRLSNTAIHKSCISWKPGFIRDYTPGIHLFIDLQGAKNWFSEASDILLNKRILRCKVKKSDIIAIGITSKAKIICVNRCTPVSIIKDC